MSSLLRLNPSDTKAASNLIARALHDYPLFRYLIPDARQRTKRLPVLTGYLVRVGMLYGYVYITSPNLEGVAVWLPPNLDISIFQLLFRVGVITCPFKLGLKPWKGIWNYVQHIELLKTSSIAKTPKQPENYVLQIFGLLPVENSTNLTP
jgi:hypothetical protein